MQHSQGETCWNMNDRKSLLTSFSSFKRFLRGAQNAKRHRREIGRVIRDECKINRRHRNPGRRIIFTVIHLSLGNSPRWDNGTAKRDIRRSEKRKSREHSSILILNPERFAVRRFALPIGNSITILRYLQMLAIVKGRCKLLVRQNHYVDSSRLIPRHTSKTWINEIAWCYKNIHQMPPKHLLLTLTW